MIKVLFILLSVLLLSFTGCTTLSQNEDPKAWDRFVDNTKTVRGAKRAYKMGHNIEAGTEVTWRDLSSCLPSNWKPVCLSGGVITPGNIGEDMNCSVHGKLGERR